MVEKIDSTGYKRSEIGVIPEDWEVIPISKTGQYINGMAFKPSDWKKYGIPIVRIENLNDLSANFNYFQGTVDEKYILKNEDILLSWSASLGVYLWSRGTAILNQHIFKVIPNKNVNKEYLFWTLQRSIDKLNKVTHGSTMKHFQKGELERNLIALPSVPEQQKISEILSNIQTLIQSLEDLISKKKNMKQGLMQSLLTRGIGHTKFKKTEIGVVPEEWDVKSLGDPEVSRVIMGQSPPSSYYNEQNQGLPFLQGNADFGSLYPKTSIYCTKPMKLATKADILISVRAPVGELNISPFDCIIGRGLAAVRSVQDHTDMVYLYYYLKNNRKKLRAFSAGSTFDAIGKNTLINFEVASPSLNEQQRIAQILSNADKEIELLKQKRDKYKLLKTGLMQQLLTGGIRVK